MTGPGGSLTESGRGSGTGGTGAGTETGSGSQRGKGTGTGTRMAGTTGTPMTETGAAEAGVQL